MRREITMLAAIAAICLGMSVGTVSAQQTPAPPPATIPAPSEQSSFTEIWEESNKLFLDAANLFIKLALSQKPTCNDVVDSFRNMEARLSKIDAKIKESSFSEIEKTSLLTVHGLVSKTIAEVKAALVKQKCIGT